MIILSSRNCFSRSLVSYTYFLLLVLLFQSTALAHNLEFDVISLSDHGGGNWGVTYQVSGKTQSSDMTHLLFGENCSKRGATSTFVTKGGQGLQQQLSCSKPYYPTHLSSTKPLNRSLLVSVNWKSGGKEQNLLAKENNSLEITPKQKAFLPIGYFTFGMDHLFTGYDHLLFITLLSLLVLHQNKGNAKIKEMIRITTAFTVGHSITLILTAFDMVSIENRTIEFLITLSLITLAYELTQQHQTLTKRHPMLICGILGLFHGLGFASALDIAEYNGWERVLALMLFNVGIETAQIFCLLLLSCIYWLIRKRVHLVIQPMAYTAGPLAVYWSLQVLFIDYL